MNPNQAISIVEANIIIDNMLPSVVNRFTAVMEDDCEYKRLHLTKIAREYVKTLAEAVGIADAVLAGHTRIG